MPVWEEAGRRRVGDVGLGLGDGKREKDLEVEDEMRKPMLRGERERETAAAPAYAELDAGFPGGGRDLGYEGGYKPYGAGYTAYSAGGKGGA